jgi:hypothetical protein
MAEAQHIEGAVSLAAANWSDATGFTDDAELSIVTGNQTISGGLDTTGSTTGGIDYLHIRRGFTGNLGSASASASVEFDATYTTNDNFIYGAGGGRCYLTAGATTITSLVVNGAGTLYLTGGTVTSLVLQSGRCEVGQSAALGNVYVLGGSHFIDEHSSDTLGNVYVVGGSVLIKRGGTLLQIGGMGRVGSDLTTGSWTTVNQDGGVLVPYKGAIATYNGRAGVIDHRPAKVVVAIGGTAALTTPALTRYQQANNGANPTYSNLTEIGGGATDSDGGGSAPPTFGQ